MSYACVPFMFEGTLLERSMDSNGVVIRHHPRTDCDSHHAPCPFHAPSDHRMVDWPRTILNGLILRVCEHMRSHPDPDSVAFAEYMIPGGPDYNEHRCDGCCKGPPVTAEEMAAARKGLLRLERRVERL